MRSPSPENKSRRGRWEWLLLLLPLLASLICVFTATRLALYTQSTQLFSSSMLARNRANYGSDPLGEIGFARIDAAIVAAATADEAGLRITPEIDGRRPETGGTPVVLLYPTASPTGLPEPPISLLPTETLASASPTATLPVTPASPTPVAGTPISLTATASATTIPTATPSATPTFTSTPLPTSTASNTPPPTVPASATPTSTSPPPPPPTATNVPPPPATATNPPPPPSATPTHTATNMPTNTPANTPTNTPTGTPTNTPTATGVPPCLGAGTELQYDIGTPDGNWIGIACGGELITDLGVTLPITQLIFYERALTTTVALDWVVIQLSDNISGTWTTVFDWGDDIYDANTNIPIGYVTDGDGEADNEVILTNYPPPPPVSQTGIIIDVAAIAPGSSFRYIRILSPLGGDNDPAEVDAIEVFPPPP